MIFGNPVLEIIGISFVMVCISQFVQRKLVDRKKMKSNQALMKEKQKRIKELMQKDDQKSKAEVERLQKEMLGLMNQTMQGTMKHMLFTFPVFIVVFWVLSIVYSGILIQLPFAVPVVHRNFSFEITAGISWLWWYIYTSFAFSILFSIVFKALKR